MPSCVSYSGRAAWLFCSACLGGPWDGVVPGWSCLGVLRLRPASCGLAGVTPTASYSACLRPCGSGAAAQRLITSLLQMSVSLRHPLLLHGHECWCSEPNGVPRVSQVGQSVKRPPGSPVASPCG